MTYYIYGNYMERVSKDKDSTGGNTSKDKDFEKVKVKKATDKVNQ